MNTDSIGGLTWLLPTSTLVLILYVAGAIAAAKLAGVPLWLLLILGIFPIMLTWVALIVAFIDVSRRPKAQITDEARLIWVMLLAILNVFAFFPYWLVVIRRSPQVPA